MKRMTLVKQLNTTISLVQKIDKDCKCQLSSYKVWVISKVLR